MKVIFVTLLVVAAAFGAAIQQDTMAEGPRCPIDDPLTVEPGNINTTESVVKPIILISENSRQEGAVAKGLRTLYYKIEINAILLTATFEASLDKADITGAKYTADGKINAAPFSSAIFPSGDFVGAGSFFGSITGGKVAGKATLFINLISNRVSCSKLTISQLEFDDIDLNLGGFMVGNVNVDFVAWKAGFKEAFAKEFPEHNEEFFNERVREEIINVFLGYYTIAELIELIGDGGGTQAPCATTPSSIW